MSFSLLVFSSFLLCFVSSNPGRLLLEKENNRFRDHSCDTVKCGIAQICLKGRCITPCNIACPNDKHCKDTPRGARCSKDYDFCIAALCPKGTECISRRRNFECVPIDDSCICTLEINPVCCDGVEYGNKCKADCAKAENCVLGVCNDDSDNKVPCGGLLGLECDKGYYCQDDPSDSCNPECGGADCIGYCAELQAPNPGFCGVRGGIFCDTKNGFECVNPTDDKCDICLGIADCPGICARPQTPTPSNNLCICTADYKPVCCNGKTYPNQCGADCDKAEFCVSGECIPCGGFAGTPCTAKDAICQDIPNDDCNPECGGADCPGFCVFLQRNSVTCNGIAGFQCEKPYVCYDQPDGCNAECGGRDCGGICGTPITTNASP